MDLTAITTPFGLLDAATQAALKAHGGPWEIWSHLSEWVTVHESDGPTFTARDVWRVKPAPPKPREWWLLDGNVFDARFDAESWCDSFEMDRAHIVHVIEKHP